VTTTPSGSAALAIVVVVVAGAGASLLLWRVWPSPRSAAPPASQPSLDELRADGEATRPAPSQPAAPASPPAESSARPSAPAVPPPPSVSEPVLTATLRLMVETAPLQTLDLARQARRRFGNGTPAAPERDWIIVKSLVNLRRFHEARDEAKAMVDKYPDNELTQDVRRHLLVYPLDQPSREEMQQRDAAAP
jgi:hypothetical protein